MRFAPILALLALAAPALAHDPARTYQLPGDPDTMVRRGPEVPPVATPETGGSAVRVEELPSSPSRPAPETSLTVTREVYLPRRPVHYPDPRWRLRITRENGDWSGDLVIGTPGLVWWPEHVPTHEPRPSARAGRPGDG